MSNEASVSNAADGLAKTEGERSFWGWLASWGPYQTLMSVVTLSPRRQFFILATFPILWLLTQHLGPMLQMLRVSLLDAYPVAPDVVNLEMIYKATSFGLTPLSKSPST